VFFAGGGRFGASSGFGSDRSTRGNHWVLLGPKTFYVVPLLDVRFEKIKLARAGNTAVRRGNRKPPC
jgi:hypothetical protein